MFQADVERAARLLMRPRNILRIRSSLYPVSSTQECRSSAMASQHSVTARCCCWFGLPPADVGAAASPTGSKSSLAGEAGYSLAGEAGYSLAGEAGYSLAGEAGYSLAG